MKSTCEDHYFPDLVSFTHHCVPHPNLSGHLIWEMADTYDVWMHCALRRASYCCLGCNNMDVSQTEILGGILVSAFHLASLVLWCTNGSWRHLLPFYYKSLKGRSGSLCITFIPSIRPFVHQLNMGRVVSLKPLNGLWSTIPYRKQLLRMNLSLLLYIDSRYCEWTGVYYCI